MIRFIKCDRRVVILLALLLSACQPEPAATKKAVSPAKTTYPVAETSLNLIHLEEVAAKRMKSQTVQMRTMPRARSYGADLMLPSGATVIVSAPLAGTLQTSGTSFPQVGETVKESDGLLELLPLLSPERAVLTPSERIRFAEAKNALAQSRIDADGQFQQATVQVEAATIALERADRLLREQAGTIRAVDEAKAQLQLAKKALAAATTRKRLVDGILLDEKAGTLEPIVITSPMSGIIRNTQVRAGQMIAAGAPLFEVMNDEILWLRVPVYVGDLNDIDIEKPARLTLLDGRQGDGDLLVKPATLPPTALPLTAAVDLYFELPNPKHAFRPGQKVAAQLTLKGAAKQLAVPWSAVIHDIYGGQWVYEETTPGEYVRRRVDVGWVDGDWAALQHGPQPGTRVVTAGVAELAGTEFGFQK